MAQTPRSDRTESRPILDVAENFKPSLRITDRTKEKGGSTEEHHDTDTVSRPRQHPTAAAFIFASRLPSNDIEHGLGH